MTRTIKTLTVLAALAMAPATAWAGDFGFNLDIGGREGHVGVGVHVGDQVGVGVYVGRAQPVAVSRQGYIPPEYAVVTERVWVPTTQTVIREVPVYDAYGQVVAYRQEPQIVQSGYWTTVQKQVLIRQGYFRRTAIGNPHRRYPAVNVSAHAGGHRQAW